MIRDYVCEKCGYESHNGGLKFTVRYQQPLDELLIVCPYCGYSWREKCHKAETRPEGQVTPKAGGTMMKHKLLAARALMFAAILSMAINVKTVIQFAIHYYRGETPAWFLFCMCAVAVWVFNIMLDVRDELREAKEQDHAR